MDDVTRLPEEAPTGSDPQVESDPTGSSGARGGRLRPGHRPRRPFASIVLLLAIALATFGFFASRVGERLFGRDLLD